MTPWRPRRLGRSIPFASLTAAAVVASGGVAPAAATASVPPAGRRFTPGAPGLGDPWYPLEGNGGYTVRHYDLDLAYDPGSGRLDGTAGIAARATQDLSRFDLDLRGLTVRAVTVGGRRAAYRRDGQELVVTPPRGLPDGSAFTVTVAYGGVPRPLGGDAPYGFVRTDDGAVVESVEDGASTWFPCDDHPSEKATYTFRVRVPAGLGVVANGRLVSRRTARGATTYTWAERAPMATYLATIDIGRWTVRTGRTPGGIPEYVAADPKLAGTDPAHPAPLRHFWDTTARVTDLWTKVFGPYPFDSTGAVAVLAKYQGTTVPFSEEAQTRPVYSDADSDEVIAHELAHQWFGDSVGLTRWTEIWLSEGFATFAAWYWDERNGGTPARAQARQVYDSYPADSPFWQVVTAAPKAPDQYAGARVYLGGAMALELLRERIGDDRFFALLRAWAARHRYGNATSAEFAALANEVSGQDLGGFFHAWIFSTGKPRFPQAATALPRGHAAAAESLTKSR